MSDKPKVVVVMPAYNAAKTLRMTYADLPRDMVDLVILVDDGSSDGTREIVAKYSGVRCVRHAENYGLSVARNTGIEAATGELIAFTDADCRVPPHWVAKILSDFESKPDIVGVGGKLSFYDVHPILDKAFQLILYFNSALPGNNVGFDQINHS